MYTVTRQRQWSDGAHLVAIPAGSFDYTTPDALVDKFTRLGEGETPTGRGRGVACATYQSRQRVGTVAKPPCVLGGDGGGSNPAVHHI